MHSFIQTLDFNYIEESVAREFSPNWDMFLNLNTRDDLNNYISQTWGNLNESN